MVALYVLVLDMQFLLPKGIPIYVYQIPDTTFFLTKKFQFTSTKFYMLGSFMLFVMGDGGGRLVVSFEV